MIGNHIKPPRSRKPPVNLVVPQLIGQALLKMPFPQELKALSPIVDYYYNNLWMVYTGKRPMPPLPLRNLCRFLGMNDTRAFEIIIEQDQEWGLLSEKTKSASTKTKNLPRPK